MSMNHTMNESYYLGPYDRTVVVTFKVLAPHRMTFAIDLPENLTLEELTDESTTIFKLIPGNAATVTIRSLFSGRFELSVVKHPFIGVPKEGGLDRSARDGAPYEFDPPEPPLRLCVSLECHPIPIVCPPGQVPVCVNGELQCKSATPP
ncbi:MAG: hypothetical protein ACC628_02430 [Pirellulaceae bacterium]